MSASITPKSSTQSTPCSVFHTLANTAIVCLLASLVINLFLGGAGEMALHGAMTGVIISGSLMLLALILGAIALCGIPRYGSKCLLWEGLVSVLVPVLLIALAIPVYRIIRVKTQMETPASQHGSLAP